MAANVNTTKVYAGIGFHFLQPVGHRAIQAAVAPAREVGCIRACLS
jgi:hypothetical protein